MARGGADTRSRPPARPLLRTPSPAPRGAGGAQTRPVARAASLRRMLVALAGPTRETQGHLPAPVLTSAEVRFPGKGTLAGPGIGRGILGTIFQPSTATAFSASPHWPLDVAVEKPRIQPISPP